MKFKPLFNFYSNFDPNEKRNMIEKILQDRRKEASNQEESCSTQKEMDLLQSPEQNWDDIVNKDVVNKFGSEEKSREHGIYGNFSKFKNFMFNSDSKTLFHQKETPGEQERKSKFENDSKDLENNRKTDSKYFQKIKNK